MLEMLSFSFMRTALIVAIFIGLASATIGQTVVLRRQANIGDALSHSALAGVALGVVIGMNPTIWSLIGTLVAAFVLELIRRLFARYAEIASAIVIATSVGLAGILSNMAGTGRSFSSYLFGSIVAISPAERNLTIVVSAIVVLFGLLFYKELFFMSFDPEGARLAGVNTVLVDTLFTVMTALTVGVASRSVGTLVISSLLVIPYAAAMQLHLNYKNTYVASMIIGAFSTVMGVVASYLYGLAPGGTIVLFSVLVLLVLSIFSRLFMNFKAKNLRTQQEQAKKGPMF